MSYEKIAVLSQVVSAVFFIAVMVWIWIKLIQPAVLAAQTEKNRQINEAERHRDEAKAALASLRGEIETAGRDAQATLERARAQGDREYETTLREAREEGDRAVRNAQGELDRRLTEAREQLRSEFLEKALGVARTEAAQRVDALANVRLVDEFLHSLESGGKN